jgi:hypothetical protein
MIGYDLGDMGGGGPAMNPVAVRESWGRTADWLRNRVPEVLEPVWDHVGRVVEVARWGLERVGIVYPVVHERWQTGADERVCPECGPLEGATWLEGEGIVPPLHVNCRCTRVHAFVEWRTRYVAAWRLRWTTRTEWEWQITGWH